MTSYPFDDYQRPAGETPAPGAYDGLRWGGGEVAIGGAAVVASLVVLIVITGLVLNALGFEAESAEGLVAQSLTSLVWDLGIVFIVYSIVKSKGSTWADLGLRRLRRDNLAAIVPIGYIACIFIVQAYSIGLNALGLDELLPDQQLPDDIYDYRAILIGFAVVGVTIVPFAEELFFRGFFFAGLRRRLGFLLAAAFSGCIFSLAHADIGLIIPFTGVGMVLAYSYERTGSLFAPIGIHMLFNLVSFLVLILVPEARNN